MNFRPPATTATLLPLADAFDGYHGWDGGWWIVMIVAMLIFWGLVIAGGVWLVRELAGRRGHHETRPPALEILDRRLAEDAISIEEYGERRRALLDSAERDTPGS